MFSAENLTQIKELYISSSGFRRKVLFVALIISSLGDLNHVHSAPLERDNMKLKPENNSTNYLEAVHGIIIPAFVFAVEHIIKIEPRAELFIYLKLCAST
jgi:hypothetical protein